MKLAPFHLIEPSFDAVDDVAPLDRVPVSEKHLSCSCHPVRLLNSLLAVADAVAVAVCHAADGELTGPVQTAWVGQVYVKLRGMANRSSPCCPTAVS